MPRALHAKVIDEYVRTWAFALPARWLRQKLIRLDDPARDCRRCDYVRRRQIEFAGSAAAGKVSVLRADRHRLCGFRSAGSGVDTGAARGIDQFGARFGKNFEVAFFA